MKKKIKYKDFILDKYSIDCTKSFVELIEKKGEELKPEGYEFNNTFEFVIVNGNTGCQCCSGPDELWISLAFVKIGE